MGDKDRRTRTNLALSLPVEDIAWYLTFKFQSGDDDGKLGSVFSLKLRTKHINFCHQFILHHI